MYLYKKLSPFTPDHGIKSLIQLASKEMRLTQYCTQVTSARCIKPCISGFFCCNFTMHKARVLGFEESTPRNQNSEILSCRRGCSLFLKKLDKFSTPVSSRYQYTNEKNPIKFQTEQIILGNRADYLFYAYLGGFNFAFELPSV